MSDKKPVDSIIFDMDGTLWDAVDSYVTIWNTTLDSENIPHKEVTRADLLSLMGSYLDDILSQLVPDVKKRESLLKRVMENETEMMPRLGGVLYPGVRETLKNLSAKYRLFMVSNCGPGGLENFVTYNGLQDCFTDLLSHGGTGRSKAENILALKEKYGLENPVYVGDTKGDGDSAHKAGVPVVWAAYGFGTIDDADAVIHKFDELPSAIERIDSRES